MPSPSSLPDLLSLTLHATAAARTIASGARRGVLALVAPEGPIDPARLEAEQHAVHGFAWLSTYVEALAQMRAWAGRLEEAGRFGELEALMLQVAFGEYLNQIFGGLPMSQGEMTRLADFGLTKEAVSALETAEIALLRTHGNTTAVRARLAGLLEERGDWGDPGLGDETLEMIRDQFRRFGEDEIKPMAQRWHLDDALIPDSVIVRLAELGVFGLTIPENHGGLGLGKTAMCVVTEELSRTFLGVGSLGTRAEIAAELIRANGTEAQKRRYLPRLASGEILPTAVFTEPNCGSDLGALRTRAVKLGEVYKVSGNKTWITHGARSDLMTLLVRTDPQSRDYRGLSLLLAEKPRGSEADPFPATGMSGGEIRVLGYRGMKEYEIAFDDFEVPADALLGGVEGLGFKQLMGTFESARIQTAARAVGVAQAAMETGKAYARDRIQFGKPLFSFPRVFDKIAWMASETMLARQLTLFAAAEKDGERRCDVEAGMAKLLAARVAWSNADNALQIHGGNGYAEEYAVSRLLCDARVLSIFEGSAEIQAQVVARGLLSRQG